MAQRPSRVSPGAVTRNDAAEPTGPTTLRVTCPRLNSDGEGVARLADGITVFVPGLLPGETADIEVVSTHKTYARGRLLQLIEESPHRTAPASAGVCSCGGCSIGHLAYGAQLEYKHQKVVDALERIGRLKVAGRAPVGGQAHPGADASSAPNEPPAAPVASGVGVGACLPAPQQLHYRNKLQLLATAGPRTTAPRGPAAPAGGAPAIVGLCEPGTNHVVPYSGCALAEPLVDEAARAAVAAVRTLKWPGKIWEVAYRNAPPSHPQPPLYAALPSLRHIVVRTFGGEVAITVVTDPASGPQGAHPARRALQRLADETKRLCPALTSFAWNQNGHATSERVFGPYTEVVAGKPFLTWGLLGITFRVSPTAFTQVNTAQTELLYTTALDFAGLPAVRPLEGVAAAPSADPFALDLYCGIGTLTLAAAGRGARVLGVEVVPQAIDDALANAQANGLGALAQFGAGAVERVLPTLLGGAMSAWKPLAVALLDPPRRGCDPVALEAVVAAGPSRIVYIGCDPAAMARDLARLAARGYEVTRVQPIDMFPQTPHVECVAQLELRR